MGFVVPYIVAVPVNSVRVDDWTADFSFISGNDGSCRMQNILSIFFACNLKLVKGCFSFKKKEV